MYVPEKNRPPKCFLGLGSYILDLGKSAVVARRCPSEKYARDNYTLRHLVNNYLRRLATKISVCARDGIYRFSSPHLYAASNCLFLFTTGLNENSSPCSLSLFVTPSLSFLFLGTLLFSFFFVLCQSPSSLFPHADVRLWALCPISLTRDRWSSRASMK